MSKKKLKKKIAGLENAVIDLCDRVSELEDIVKGDEVLLGELELLDPEEPKSAPN